MGRQIPRGPGRKLDGSWAGGKGSFRRSGEDKAAFELGYDSINWSNQLNDADPRPRSKPSPALAAQWQRQLDIMTEELDQAEEAVEAIRDRISSWMEDKDDVL
jgi:hypothetical protein